MARRSGDLEFGLLHQENRRQIANLEKRLRHLPDTVDGQAARANILREIRNLRRRG